MPSLNSLVTQPQSPEPPDVQGTSGTGKDSGLPMQQGGAPQAGSFQMPNHQETAAVLQHISAFDRQWRDILGDPDIGKGSVRGRILDAMADLMGDGYCSLPQTMSLLKSLPTDPLEQKQWLEQHIQNDEKAMVAVLQHHAAGAPPPGDWKSEMAAAGKMGDRADLVNGVMGRYKAHKNKPQRMNGVPIRG